MSFLPNERLTGKNAASKVIQAADLFTTASEFQALPKLTDVSDHGLNGRVRGYAACDTDRRFYLLVDRLTYNRTLYWRTPRRKKIFESLWQAHIVVQPVENPENTIDVRALTRSIEVVHGQQTSGNTRSSNVLEVHEIEMINDALVQFMAQGHSVITEHQDPRDSL